MLTRSSEANKLVSIIIPCYNEEKNIDRTLDQLLELIKKHKYDFEIIAVNDGSKDNTWEVIEQYATKHKEIIGINQMTNFGQSQAYQAGFDIAKGDYIVTVSADLEIPLKEVIKVIRYLDKGFDFVNTNRVGRWNDGRPSRSMKSGYANKLIKRISGMDIKDRGSGVKGMTYQIAKSLNLYGEMHRFMPDYACIYGARIYEFDVKFKDRDYGISAYNNTSRTLNVLLDLITLIFMLYFAKKPFHMMPGRLFGFTGVLLSLIGFVVAIVLIFQRIVFDIALGDRPIFIVSITMFILGVIMFLFGMFGELIMRVYFEATGKKPYMVRRIVG